MKYESDDLIRDNFSLFFYHLQVPRNPPKASLNQVMTTKFLSHLTLPITRMIFPTLLIAVMMLLTLLAPYQSSGEHWPCNQTAEKTSLKAKTNQSITVAHVLNVISILSKSISNAIKHFMNQLSMINQSFCAGNKFRICEKISLK